MVTTLVQLPGITSMSAYEVRECPERSTRTCSAAAEDHRMPVPNGTPLHSNSYGLRSVSSLFVVYEDYYPWLGGNRSIFYSPT